MQYLYEKIAYLRGLCDGFGFDESTKEGKIFSGILDVLDEMTNIIEDLDEEGCCFNPEDLEDGVDGDREFTYSFMCPGCGDDIEIDQEILENDKEVACPKCGRVVPINPEEWDLKF